MRTTSAIAEPGRSTFLKSCALPLAGQYEATITFLRAYYFMLADRILYELANPPHALLITDWEEEALSEW